MKKWIPMIMLAVVLLASSCSKDEADKTASEILVGTWNTSDGGTITFRADKTGTTNNSAAFEVDLGNGPVADFTWLLVNDNYLMLEFKAGSSSGAFEQELQVITEDEIHVGLPSGFAGLDVTLTR